MDKLSYELFFALISGAVLLVQFLFKRLRKPAPQTDAAFGRPTAGRQAPRFRRSCRARSAPRPSDSLLSYPASAVRRAGRPPAPTDQFRSGVDPNPHRYPRRSPAGASDVQSPPGSAGAIASHDRRSCRDEAQLPGHRRLAVKLHSHHLLHGDPRRLVKLFCPVAV